MSHAGFLKSRKIGVFHLAMITVSYVASIRTMAMMAKYGFSSLFLYLLGAICFLLPTALVSAELATTFPSKGGVYTWVNEAIPGPFGFLAIWLQFLSSVLGLPVFLSFLAATFAFAISPDLANNPYYLTIFILALIWFSAFMSCFGMKTVGWLNTFAVIFGLLLPMSLILILAIVWVASGNPLCVEVSTKTFFPHFTNFYSLIFMAGLLFSLTGMETSGSHALDLHNVQKDYPRAMILTSFIVFIVGFGAFAIAMVVPSDKINLVAGLMDAFAVFLSRFHLNWLIPIVALSIVLGYIGGLTSNFIGPSKGLYGTARHGEIPPILSKENKYGMPANMFIFVAVLATILSCVFLFMPDINSAYLFILDAVTALYMFMYVLMFLSGIILRFTKPDVHRPYKVFGGKPGMILIAGLGLISSLAGIVISFIPPEELVGKHAMRYELYMIICILALLGLGYLFYRNKHEEWVNKDVK